MCYCEQETYCSQAEDAEFEAIKPVPGPSLSLPELPLVAERSWPWDPAWRIGVAPARSRRGPTRMAPGRLAPTSACPVLGRSPFGAIETFTGAGLPRLAGEKVGPCAVLEI